MSTVNVWTDKGGINSSLINQNPLVTAHPGGGQANATQLLSGYSAVIVGSNEDSVALPPATPSNSPCLISTVNSGNFMSVFSKNGSSDTINGSPSGTAYQGGFYFCFTPGAWVCTGTPI